MVEQLSKRILPKGFERRGVRAKSKKASSLTERIYRLLKADILTCSLAPGQEVSEAEISERFAVSKTPVREALAMLRSEGFVRIFPRRGYQVVPITFGDMNELFDIRTILEVGAAELACVRITDAELKQLERRARVIYDQNAQTGLKRFIQANSEFHLAIAKASGNERLHKILNRQLDEVERFFYLGARLRDVSDETKNNHHVIVQALAKRDPTVARQVMIRHNEMTRQGLLQALASSDNICYFSV